MRDITLCHPRLQVLAAKLVEECSKQGLIIMIGETYRTVAEQDALYAQGRTTPGNIVTNAPGSTYSSYHQWGTAFDFFRNDGQGAYNEAGNFFGRVGAIGVSLGLEWGGNWKSPVDKPHFQLPDWGSSTTGIKKVYANPDVFKNTWTAEIPKEKKSGWHQEDEGWRFYNDDTGECVRNNWHQDIEKDLWYWFDGAGLMVTNTWYQYKGGWYYLNADGVMLKGTLIEESGKVYCLDGEGKMIVKPVTLTPGDDGALRYLGLVK
ncbi:D-alanyl-D-alanine carboxypeptidase,cell wall-binding repeat-containing protein [Clostridium sp. ASBs410]|nr:D-alanyl-D-alanine carboxypeptidase,cell wall-binding repeat-containing protein [Clostridium sp. ASBs410]